MHERDGSVSSLVQDDLRSGSSWVTASQRIRLTIPSKASGVVLIEGWIHVCSAPDLFAASESYLTGDTEFDDLFALALGALPDLQARSPEAPATRLAVLIVASEAEQREFSGAERRVRLAEFLETHAAGRRR